MIGDDQSRAALGPSIDSVRRLVRIRDSRRCILRPSVGSGCGLCSSSQWRIEPVTSIIRLEEWVGWAFSRCISWKFGLLGRVWAVGSAAATGRWRSGLGSRFGVGGAWSFCDVSGIVFWIALLGSWSASFVWLATWNSRSDFESHRFRVFRKGGLDFVHVVKHYLDVFLDWRPLFRV